MRPTRSILLSLAAVAALVFAGCGANAEERLERPTREGLAIPLDGLRYFVFVTRQLNLADPEDKGYYPGGTEAPPGKALYGVFLEACNPGDEPREATDEFVIEDAQGNEFRPRALDADNPFAYKARTVAPKNCIPARGSLAQQGPTSGAMLLFELSLEAAENRPLELKVTGVEGEEATFELDI